MGTVYLTTNTVSFCESTVLGWVKGWEGMGDEGVGE